jgi:hypothetical protein
MKLIILILSSLACFARAGPARLPPRGTPSHTFTYNSTSFLLDGKPFQIFGGQMDPQRVPRAYWADRLAKAKAMGLNTIFSYTYWNVFEEVQGTWNFTGDNDIAAFYRAVSDAGMWAVLRPGPYVCGERDWGGLPAYLSQISGLTIRANNKPFLTAAQTYLKHIAAQLNGSLVHQGGPILMVQVENEYGQYGSDHSYTSALKDLLSANFDSILYTNDAGNQGSVVNGQVPGTLTEIDGDPRSGFSALKQYRSSPGPLLDGEYYTKWFDFWGPHSSHQTYDGDTAGTNSKASDIDWIISQGGSFSLYMWHGGTNWGFGNGAVNFGSGLEPFTTSYDYGAPLDESGRPNNLYSVLRSTIGKHLPSGSIPAVPSSPPLQTLPDTPLTPVAGLFDTLPTPQSSLTPLTMEALGQQSGYVLYEYRVASPVNGKLSLGSAGPRDRVIVYVNGQKKGVIDAIYKTPASVTLSLQAGDLLWLFVENLGRVDYGMGTILDQRKGIVGGTVEVGGKALAGGEWKHYSFPLKAPPPPSTTPANATSSSSTTPKISSGSPPVWYRGTFASARTGPAGDTFLALPGGTKGVVFVNGFNLGRYWAVGPQQQLYLPGSLLRTDAANEIWVLELSPGTSNATRTARGVVVRSWGNQADPECGGCS